jgi:beta-N-acetylhexosaminidase
MRFALVCFLAFSWSLAGKPVDQERSWAEKTLSEMSIEEKIGQLFMIAGYVDPEFALRETAKSDIAQEIDHYIEKYHIGAIAYVGPSTFLSQVALTNHYQKISKHPILIAQDLEWGLSMRIKDGMSFPKNSTLGTLLDDRLIYEMGKEIGRQARLIGVHMNLSPVLDVNIEPENIVINVRSFGSSPKLVAEKGVAMIRGLQDAGIIASAKHFPGLGDIITDPHIGLPYSNHSRKRLQDVELYPFTRAIQAGVLSIQTEHLLIPALEPDTYVPSSLSAKVVEGVLKKELGFTGLVLSGALRMKALTNNFSEEEIAVRAFTAGNDMLLMPNDLPKAYEALKTALEEGVITQEEIDKRVLKILQLKEKVELDKQRAVFAPTRESLHSLFGKKLKKALYQKAAVVKRDQEGLLPILPKASIAYVQLGETVDPYFLTDLSKQFTFDSYNFPLQGKRGEEERRLFAAIDSYSMVIVAVYPADPRRIVEIRLLNEQKQQEELQHFRVHGMTESLVRIANALKKHQKKIAIVFFGNPFGLHFFDGFSTLIMAHEQDKDAQQAASALLQGKSCN